MGKIGIVSWNVNGDSDPKTSQKRVNDLSAVIQDLEKGGKRIDFLCFQETSGPNSAAQAELIKKGYTCKVLKEGDDAGRWYLFALNRNSGYSFLGDPVRIPLAYPPYIGATLRYPALAQLKAPDGTAVALYNFHAPLAGALEPGLMGFSNIVVDATKYGGYSDIYVAGDLNIDNKHCIFDEKSGRIVNTLKKLFPGFIGSSSKLDHIFRFSTASLRTVDGSSYETSSDHALLFAEFKI